LANHDRDAVEVFCYSDVRRPDDVTARLRGHAGVWREITNRSDADVADQIRADEIDVLVDLTMHLADNRLPVFGRKPAPVQVSWLAYPGTTGVRDIEYRLSDPFLDPIGSDTSVYTETTIRLADTFWCYDPLAREPQPGPLPALEAGHVTFGCLNNF